MNEKQIIDINFNSKDPLQVSLFSKLTLKEPSLIKLDPKIEIKTINGATSFKVIAGKENYQVILNDKTMIKDKEVSEAIIKTMIEKIYYDVIEEGIKVLIKGKTNETTSKKS